MVLFVKMRLFADVALYMACQTGATSKRRAVDRTVAVGSCRKSDARGRNPPLLFLRTCHLPHVVRHVHKSCMLLVAVRTRSLCTL